MHKNDVCSHLTSFYPQRSFCSLQCRQHETFKNPWLVQLHIFLTFELFTIFVNPSELLYVSPPSRAVYFSIRRDASGGGLARGGEGRVFGPRCCPEVGVRCFLPT